MNPLIEFLQKKSEARLGHLSFLALVVTIAHMTMMWWTFMEGKGAHPVPEPMMWLLWAVLIIYAAPKEVHRWQNPKGHRGKRPGQIFAMLWAFSLMVMSYVTWRDPSGYAVPEYMMETTVGALAIFGVSIVSKEAHRCVKEEGCDDEDIEAKRKTAPHGTAKKDENV